MFFGTLFFYLFSTVLVLSALMVIIGRNPVHSVLFLILAFFNAAALFITLGAEFLAMILLVVYVGAVAVLFLFVVMMLDIDFVEMRQGLLNYLPVSALIGGILLAELLIGLGGYIISDEIASSLPAPLSDIGDVSNIEALGSLLYTRYIFFFQLAGLVLLVGMIGSIVLTLRHKAGVKRQDIAGQNIRSRAESVEIRKVESGKGI